MNLVAPLLALCLFADAPKPPVIPDQLKAAFWKSRSLLQDAQSAFEKASAVNAAAVGDLQKFCGEGYQVQFDAQNEPSCVAKIPVENKKPEVKK